jgi:hypothetical protein
MKSDTNPAKRKPSSIMESDSGRVKITVFVDNKLWQKIWAISIIEEKLTGALLDQAIGEFLKNRGQA